MRIGENPVDGVDRPAGYAALFQGGDQFRHRVALRLGLEQWDQRRTVGDPRAVADKARIGRPVRVAKFGNQLGELAVITQRDDDEAVGTRKTLTGHPGRLAVAIAPRALAGTKV